MELIYADEDRNDIDVLENYILDVAFGRDENDFELILNLEKHCLKKDYLIYCVNINDDNGEEGTDIGGIIDAVSPNTKNNTVTYLGRSFQGILENKVIYPDNGEDYLIVDGEANEILRLLIERLNVTDMFKVEDNASKIQIVSYQFPRYVKAYTGIRKMLMEFGGKLKMQYINGYVVLSASEYIDYSNDEEFDSTQTPFYATQYFNRINHLICMGGGDLSERNVIHLFTDKNGGLKPYTYIDNPIKDDDYILDETQKAVFGTEEIVGIYDYPNVEILENYIPLKIEPIEWNKRYNDFYEKDVPSDSFKSVEGLLEKVYNLQMSKPSDWNSKYNKYYYIVDGEYKKINTNDTYKLLAVKPSDWESKYYNYYCKDGNNYIAVDSYTLIKNKPKNWNVNYENYFIDYTDGINHKWENISGISHAKYISQTEKPSDWDKKFANYYYCAPIYKYFYRTSQKQNGKWITKIEKKDKKVKDTVSNSKKVIFIKKKIVGHEYHLVESQNNNKIAPKWKLKKYFTKKYFNVAPKWESNRYYAKNVTAPKWEDGMFYELTVGNAPMWESGKFYTSNEIKAAPKWKRGVFYEKFLDHYAELIKRGIEKLKENYNNDELSISLDAHQDYSIGDFVGASENITGIEVKQPITKKIINIVKGTSRCSSTIEYEIGE